MSVPNMVKSSSIDPRISLNSTKFFFLIVKRHRKRCFRSYLLDIQSIRYTVLVEFNLTVFSHFVDDISGMHINDNEST